MQNSKKASLPFPSQIDISGCLDGNLVYIRIPQESIKKKKKSQVLIMSPARPQDIRSTHKS